MKIPDEDLERKRRALSGLNGKKPMSWITLTLAVSIGVVIGNLLFAVIVVIYLNAAADYNLPPILQNPMHKPLR